MDFKNLSLNMSKDYSAIVNKRKATIEKKRLRKAQTTLYPKNEQSYILRAGDVFRDGKTSIGDKFKISPSTVRQRERKEHEQHLKEAINGLFHIKTMYDKDFSLSLYNESSRQKEPYHEGRLRERKTENNELYNVIPNYSYIKNRITNNLKNELTKLNSKHKAQSYISIRYNTYKTKFINLPDGTLKKVEEMKAGHFNSKTFFIKNNNNINENVNILMDGFFTSLETAHNESNLAFGGIDRIEIKMNKSKAIFGASYIDLPLEIKNKQACVNIKNNDNKCFLWCLIASKFYEQIKKTEAYRYKKFLSSIKEPEDVVYPVEIDDINKWELLNDMKINVFSLDEENKLKNEYCSIVKNKNVVNLLLISNDDNNHYVWLKNLSAFERENQISHHTIYHCQQCLSARFSTRDALFRHTELCINNNDCQDEMPALEKSKLKFTNEDREFKHPFDVQADFESTLQPIDNFDEEQNTNKYQKHIPNSYGLKYNCIDETQSEPIRIFNSSNPEAVLENFINDLERLANKSYNLLQKHKNNIIMTNEEKQAHYKAKNCSYCNCLFDNDKNIKIRHHNHISGKFISTLCSKCNLNFCYKRFLPVYIHNLKGYDAHLFVKSLYKYGYKHDLESSKSNISCIPNNEERYISFSKSIKVDEYEDKKGKTHPIMFEIRFIDTFGFMAESLEALAENLKSACNGDINKLRTVFKNTSDEFKHDEQFLLMISKGIYPYDYINSFDRMRETELPKQNKFYSKLNKSRVSNEDYNKAKTVWSVFDCKTFLDYHNIYLKSDVLLLSDVWANFKEVCLLNYKLDPSYYYTAPGLSFSAMLKFTNITLDLITDYEMFLMFESGIKGGISQISKRYAKANNKYMNNYNPDEKESYIVYLDSNNLYGDSMSKYLPVGEFEWDINEWNDEAILKLGDEDEKGYVFEIDGYIPDKLHDYMNNYPVAPENITIKKEYLNEWQQEDYNETKVSKLCLTFHKKEKYVVHYRILKLYISLGFKITKIHRVIKFKQTNFLKSYIMKNTELRKVAQNEFEKNFYKLMNNSVYGKTMENVRNRVDIVLINTEKQALKLKNLKRFNIFDENLVAVHLQQLKVKLNKPIYLGMTVLDESKLLMYNFHYNFMLKNVDRKNIDLLMTDTDSLCYHIRETDIFKIMKDNKDRFDLSNYPKTHELYDGTNSKVIGKFKNESTNIITEFIGLRPKLYSFMDEEEEEVIKCKGVKKCIIKSKEIRMEHFKNTLFNRKSMDITQNGIRSYNHEIYTETMTKTALTATDDKVFISSNNIDTYNFGHYKII